MTQAGRPRGARLHRLLRRPARGSTSSAGTARLTSTSTSAARRSPDWAGHETARLHRRARRGRHAHRRGAVAVPAQPDTRHRRRPPHPRPRQRIPERIADRRVPSASPSVRRRPAAASVCAPCRHRCGAPATAWTCSSRTTAPRRHWPGTSSSTCRPAPPCHSHWSATKTQAGQHFTFVNVGFNGDIRPGPGRGLRLQRLRHGLPVEHAPSAERGDSMRKTHSGRRRRGGDGRGAADRRWHCRAGRAAAAAQLRAASCRRRSGATATARTSIITNVGDAVDIVGGRVRPAGRDQCLQPLVGDENPDGPALSLRQRLLQRRHRPRCPGGLRVQRQRLGLPFNCTVNGVPCAGGTGPSPTALTHAKPVASPSPGPCAATAAPPSGPIVDVSTAAQLQQRAGNALTRADDPARGGGVPRRVHRPSARAPRPSRSR